MKIAAAMLWLACILIFVSQYDNPVGRMAGVAFGLCAIAATMNVWSNRNDR